MIDVIQHVLVPKHEIVSSEEKNDIFKRFHIQHTDLPVILLSDPVIKRMKATVGDVIKITRKSLTAGETVYYRIVVEE